MFSGKSTKRPLGLLKTEAGGLPAVSPRPRLRPGYGGHVRVSASGRSGPAPGALPGFGRLGQFAHAANIDLSP